jgi:adenylate cyclase
MRWPIRRGPWVVLLHPAAGRWLGAAGTLYSRKAGRARAAFVVVLAAFRWAGFRGLCHGLVVAHGRGFVGALLALISGVIVSYATEGRQKRFIKSAFKQYLGETVIDDIIADPSRLKLGGEKKELTMFFSDLEKFSSFSEKLDPPQLIELLNVYLSDVGRILMEEGATSTNSSATPSWPSGTRPWPSLIMPCARCGPPCAASACWPRNRPIIHARAAGMPVRMRIG